MQPQQLDQDVVNLAKAIRQAESGGDFNARGKSGEYGAYQFTQPTWRSLAGKYLGSADAALTPENQNKAAYYQIKEWKDQGLNPGQIASMWNSGKPDPTGNVGVNEYGVKYDTPAYVQKVYNNYAQIRGPRTAQASSTEPSMAKLPPEQQQQAPQQTGMQKVGSFLDTIFGGKKIGEAIGTEIAKGTFGTGIQKFATGRDLSAEEEALVAPGPSRKEVAADVGRVALNFAPIGRLSAGLTSRLASEGMKRSAPVLGNVGVGVGLGYGFDALESAREGGPLLTQPGIGTTVGAAIPLAGPLAKGLGNIASKGTRYGVSQATGLNPETISQIVSTPQAFTKQAQSQITRESLGRSVLGDIKQAQKAVNTTGKLYEPLRSAQGFVNVPRDTIKSVLDKYGIKMVKGKLKMGPESRPISKTDAKQIEDFVKQYGSTLKLSPNAYFNAKERLSELGKYNKLAPEGKTPIGTRLARDLRAAYEQIGDKQIPGLKQLDETYAPMRQELNALRKDYLDKDGNLKDSALNKIANLTGRGKDQVLRRLEQIRPNIRQEIGVLKAIEDIQNASGIKVGTYTRGAIAAGGALTGNLGVVAGAILSQPELAVPIIRRYGLAANQVKKLVGALRGHIQNQTAQGISPGDRLLNTRAGQNLESSVRESIRRPNMGLSIRDVSEDVIPGLRQGQPPIGQGNFDEIVARERFDIPNLKKVSFGGSDRDVYDLGDGRVLKVAKSARGIDQNMSSSDYYAEAQGLIPETIEQGKNYLVKTKVNPPDAKTKAMVKELNKLNRIALVGRVGGWDTHQNEVQKAVDIMNKYGYSGDDMMNYSPLWGDVMALRNWGTTIDGLPILLDEGTLNGQLVENAMKSVTGGTKNLMDPEFRAIYNQSRAAKKKFGDVDRKTMYGLAAPLLVSPLMNNKSDQAKEDGPINVTR